MLHVAQHIRERCPRCGACFEIVACPGAEEEICVGCGACALACPNEAIIMMEDVRKGKVTIEVDGKQRTVSERITVKEALRELGYRFADLTSEPGIFAPCGVGGCGSCMVEIDGILKPACVTEAKDGMKISTKVSASRVPVRIIENFMGHPAGGVGTPWYLRKDPFEILEIICFAGGCNFRCPQCQNWKIAYRGKGSPLTPIEAAKNMSMMREQVGVNRMGISGGESTLNRPWLVRFIEELKRRNPDTNARFHVDTNGSLLTKDYIDELVDAGMTDVGIDLKSLNSDTFMRITGLEERELADKYRDVAWNAVEYLTHSHKEKVFLGIGIPYNHDFISLEEIADIGKKIYEIDPYVQVCANNYVPEFRSRISPPTYQEMKRVHEILKDTGLKTVICQTPRGYIGP